MTRFILIISSIAIIFSSCKKKEDEEVIVGPEPVIGFVSMTPMVVDNYKNSVNLIISYSDINGDIGFENPDQYALWVKDSRLDSADWYHIPPLAPPGASIPIQGSVRVVLNSMFILGNGQQEQVSLSVKLRDRAGNWSNMIYTPALTIKKP